jgi:hypothetical protein
MSRDTTVIPAGTRPERLGELSTARHDCGSIPTLLSGCVGVGLIALT